MLHLGVISLIPEMFASLQYGVTGRALAQGLAKVDCWSPRDWADRPYRQIDDKPYGGGPGMVMMYEPLAAAIKHARKELPADCRTIYLSPQGKIVQQADLKAIVEQNQSLLFIAGRYEGIDERILDAFVDEEWSLGNFVLSGGEFAAMAFIDGLLRLLPGCLGHACSAVQDSYVNGLLDYPHYTRPAEVDGKRVPAVLLQGNHKEIERWRRKAALGSTWLKKPELLTTVSLSSFDQELLAEFKHEKKGNEDNKITWEKDFFV